MTSLTYMFSRRDVDGRPDVLHRLESGEGEHVERNPWAILYVVPSASPHSLPRGFTNAFARPAALELTHHRDHDGNQWELLKLCKDQAGHSTFSSTLRPTQTLLHSLPETTPQRYFSTFSTVQRVQLSLKRSCRGVHTNL